MNISSSIKNYKEIKYKDSYVKILIFATILYYIYGRSIIKSADFVEYSAPLILIIVVYFSRLYKQKIFELNKILLIFVIYSLIITIKYSLNFWGVVAFAYMLIPIYFGISFYWLSKNKKEFIFFMKTWVLLSAISVPLGFLTNGIWLDTRDFFGLSPTPSGGIYSISILFSLLIGKIAGYKRWYYFVPLFLLPFVISESYRFLLQIIIMGICFFALQRPKYILLIVLILCITLFSLLEYNFLYMEFNNWRLNKILEGIRLIFGLEYLDPSLLHLDSRNGILLRITLIKYTLPYLSEAQALIGWGPNSSYLLLEQAGGRYIYTHNSLLEMIISYGFFGFFLFILLIVSLGKKIKNDRLTKNLWIAFVIASLFVTFVNGKMYMLNSFWIVLFSLISFSKHFSVSQQPG